MSTIFKPTTAHPSWCRLPASHVGESESWCESDSVQIGDRHDISAWAMWDPDAKEPRIVIDTGFGPGLTPDECRTYAAELVRLAGEVEAGIEAAKAGS